MNRNFCTFSLLSLLALQAQAQSPTMAANQSSEPKACQVDIAKFEQSVALVRQGYGDKVANNLREKLLPAKEADEAMNQSGQCGLARLLRAKKLV